MSTNPRATAPRLANARPIDQTLVRGALLGMVAALVMAMYAMIAAATYQHTGFFTPLYHIATSVYTNTAMMSSMQNAMAGNDFTFATGPALVGVLVHMITGAMYGIVFAVGASALRLQGAALIFAGIIFGLAIFVVSTWIALPIVAGLFGGGDPIRNMASMVGYPTFIFEHVLFGITLGALLVPSARNNA